MCPIRHETVRRNCGGRISGGCVIDPSSRRIARVCGPWNLFGHSGFSFPSRYGCSNQLTLGLDPIDHGGALAMTVAVGAAMLAVRVVEQKSLIRGDRILVPDPVGAVAVVLVVLSWIWSPVGAEFARDRIAGLIIVNCVVSAIAGAVACVCTVPRGALLGNQLSFLNSTHLLEAPELIAIAFSPRSDRVRRVAPASAAGIAITAPKGTRNRR